jgi:hypothetical protein
MIVIAKKKNTKIEYLKKSSWKLIELLQSLKDGLKNSGRVNWETNRLISETVKFHKTKTLRAYFWYFCRCHGTPTISIKIRGFEALFWIKPLGGKQTWLFLITCCKFLPSFVAALIFRLTDWQQNATKIKTVDIWLHVTLTKASATGQSSHDTLVLHLLNRLTGNFRSKLIGYFTKVKRPTHPKGMNNKLLRYSQKLRVVSLWELIYTHGLLSQSISIHGHHLRMQKKQPDASSFRQWM